MFHQLLTPVANNLFLSFLVGIIPIAVVLILLGIVRLAAWIAALAGLIVGLLIAVLVWQLPLPQAASSTLNGMVFALRPVMSTAPSFFRQRLARSLVGPGFRAG
jgi:lactate permease